MYVNVIFILYGIALLISLVCLVFIGLIFVRKNDRNNKTYMAVRSFAIVVMLTDILYFLFYYREVVSEQYELALPFRMADYTLCTAVFFFWLLIMGNMLSKDRHRTVIISGIIMNIVRLIASLIVTTAFMGPYYNINNPLICRIWTITEFTFIFITAVLMIYCTICVLTETESRLRKKYTVLVSTLLLIWSTIQGIVDTGLFASEYGVSAWAMETPDFTGAILFLVNLSTCIFVFKEDFSPLFFEEAGTHISYATSSTSAALPAYPDAEKPFAEDLQFKLKLDSIAFSHKLTVREREVLELMYHGYTNPDIGKKLFISINTVKKHTHNIFEKLDVSNRMEVVHLINSLKINM